MKSVFPSLPQIYLQNKNVHTHTHTICLFMKPSIPVAHLNNVTPDAIRWFIIGAYQAGASESEIVSLTNLSRYTIRYTIASFVKTGLPSMRTQKSK